MDSRSKSFKETKSESGVFFALEAEDEVVYELEGVVVCKLQVI